MIEEGPTVYWQNSGGSVGLSPVALAVPESLDLGLLWIEWKRDAISKSSAVLEVSLKKLSFERAIAKP
jgi:hypothetical protein